MGERPGTRWTAAAALIVIVALALSGCAGRSAEPKTSAAQAIRVAASTVILKDGTTEPKVVIGVYEDFLCPACRRFEVDFGPAVQQLTAGGKAAVDYYMVAILDRRSNDDYSSRASAAGYCVADVDTSPDKAAFQRFHAALYAQQPDETGSTFPDDRQLTETARQAGAYVSDCVEDGRHLEMAGGLAAATGVTSTPTLRINGQDYKLSTPAELTAYVEKLLR